MVTIAVVVLLASVCVLLWAMRRQQQQIHALNLHVQQATVPVQTLQAPPSPEEQRLLLLCDDCEFLIRQITLAKVHSRNHCVQRHGFSEYRWNKARRVLLHLGIYDGCTMGCSYAEARKRLRTYMRQQTALCLAQGRYVPPV